jgi:hypothetical protein
VRRRSLGRLDIAETAVSDVRERVRASPSARRTKAEGDDRIEKMKYVERRRTRNVQVSEQQFDIPEDTAVWQVHGG